ncbi:hypothetical protein [Saccharothrix syringae]|uniref:Uncharacterized protein n=1 Tax=Saccharothrix syringae TaxID=103733 RepID=A0A5Q0H2V2_SACSY|nr:hypothetical protein [Saccharothrix syringae]QFZ20204.1 hypothetical protein EKG83_24825 [Saccharothrix syringae]
MRTRHWRALIAAALSALVIIPLGGQPVRATAAEQPPQAYLDWTKVVVAAISAIGSWASSANTEEAIKQATTQILSAVNSAKAEILAQMETIAVAELRACANHAFIEYIDIERMAPDNMQQFAQNATGCAVQIASTLPAISDAARKDQLGFALSIVSPIALNARGRTGLTTEALASTLLSAQEHIAATLLPNCWSYVPALQEPDFPRPRPGDYIGWDLFCEAYNYTSFASGYGVFRYPNEGPTEVHWAPLRDQASSTTSRGIAIAVIPLLRR